MCPGPGKELFPVRVQDPGVLLFRETLAEIVGLLRAHPRQGDAHPGDVLLVYHDPEGFRENLVQQRVEGPVGTAVEPGEVLPDKAVGRGADDGGIDHEEVEGIAPGLPAEKPGGRALGVEHPHGIAPSENIPGGLILGRVE